MENDTRVPTMDDLYRLARTQPVVYQALMMLQRGDITQEHALIGIVLTLADQLEKANAQVIDYMRRYPEPVVVYGTSSRLT